MEPLLPEVESARREKFKTLSHVLSNPDRIAIVKLLSQTDKLMVTEIYRTLELVQGTTSQHLNALKLKGVLNSERDGQKTYYSLAMPEVIKVVDMLLDL